MAAEVRRLKILETWSWAPFKTESVLSVTQQAKEARRDPLHRADAFGDAWLRALRGWSARVAAMVIRALRLLYL